MGTMVAEELRAPQIPIANSSTKEPCHDSATTIETWDGPDDPGDPFNWPLRKKWWATGLGLLASTRKAIDLVDTDLGPHLHVPVRIEDVRKLASPSHRDTDPSAPTVGSAPEALKDRNHIAIGVGQWTRATHPIAVRTIPANRVEEVMIADEKTGMGTDHTGAVRVESTQVLRLGNCIGAALHLK
ncbi:hypothetical protein GTR04_2353 [Trichophyton interdigitale]|nr:hypothetical protein GTR04_2353 [Trichophyton interdigitale]